MTARSVSDLAADVEAALRDWVHDPQPARSLSELVARLEAAEAARADLEVRMDAEIVAHVRLRDEYFARAKAAEAQVAALTQERDALRKALQDELDNWNPEARPTITARAEAAEAALADTRRALEQIASSETVLAIPGVLDRSFAGRTAQEYKAIARRALAAAGGGTAYGPDAGIDFPDDGGGTEPITCEKCRHPAHDPDACPVNVGTGYMGPVLCRCGTGQEQQP